MIGAFGFLLRFACVERERSASHLKITLGLLAVCLTLLWPSPLLAEFGDPIKGQSLFVSKGCVECHAVRGAGGRVGPDLGRAAVKSSFYEIASAMWNHSLGMEEKMLEFRVVRPRFDGDELADLLAFLYFLNYFDEPGDPQIGKVLFAEKHCIQCHSLGKQGGSTGPRLDTIPRGTPPLRIAQDLWNHGPVMVPAIRQYGFDVPQFKGSEIVDLFAYLRSQGQRQAAKDFRSAGDPQSGKRLFESKGCARCHAIFDKGVDIGPDLGKSDLRGSVTQLAGRMWNHWPAMSQAMSTLGMAVPTFKNEELADVFAYLFIARYDGRGGNPERGKEVYASKACASCHGPMGYGGVGPSIRTDRPEPKERLVQRMWNHAPKMYKTMGLKGIDWPRFEPQDMADLLAFVTAETTVKPALPAQQAAPAR